MRAPLAVIVLILTYRHAAANLQRTYRHRSPAIQSDDASRKWGVSSRHTHGVPRRKSIHQCSRAGESQQVRPCRRSRKHAPCEGAEDAKGRRKLAQQRTVVMRSVITTKKNIEKAISSAQRRICELGHASTRSPELQLPARSTISPSLELIHRHPHEAHGMAYAAKHKVTKALDPVI